MSQRLAGLCFSGWQISFNFASRSSPIGRIALFGSIVQKGQFSAGTLSCERALKVRDLPALGSPTNPALIVIPGNPHSRSWSSVLAIMVYKVIIVIIMIKSSDKTFDNTYRILRVLSNQDYLATDQHGLRYIFSETRPDSKARKEEENLHSPSKREAKYLLRHRELIVIDHLQYAVFEVGNHEVTWAPLILKKKLQSQSYVHRMIKHSVEKILKELIWMTCIQARKYLDLRNFWIVNDELSLIMLPRIKKGSFSLRRSEKQTLQVGERSLDLIIESQKVLMKEFALQLWQICFQTSYYEYSDSSNLHQQSKQVLKSMISKAVTFEDLLKELSKQIFSEHSKKVRLKTISHYDLFQRRKTISSIAKTQTISSYLNRSRITQPSTETIKGYETPAKGIHQTHKQKQETASSDKKWLKKTDERRSMSQSNSISYDPKSIRFRQTKYLQRRQTYSSTKDAVHYQNWLQRKKYSHEVREKLLKNSEIAMRKFKESIRNDRPESEDHEIKDVNFRQKILSKVIKFKKAFKQKHSTLPNNSLQNCQQSISQASNAVQSKPQSSEKPFSQKQLRNDNTLNLSLNNDKSQSSPSQQNLNIKYESLKQQPLSQKEEKISNEYRIDRQSSPIDMNSLDMNSLKTEKKKFKRIDIFDQTNTDAELDIEIVQLPESNTNQTTEKQRKNLPPTANSSKIQRASKAVSQVEPREALNEFILLINTLGDITVRAVRNKDKLGDLNWRLATYYLYERFEFERSKIITCLSSSKLICRRHHKVDANEWSRYAKGRQKQDTVQQIGKENQQISTTLHRLGEKLILEEKLENKVEYYIRNRGKIASKSESRLRMQLSKLLIASIVNEFDYAFEQKASSPEILAFLMDCIFGMHVIAELDGILPVQRSIDLQEYKQYNINLEEMKPQVDYIDGLYFPAVANQQAK